MVLEPGRGSWSLETEIGAVMDGDSVEHIVDAARVLGRTTRLQVDPGTRAAEWVVWITSLGPHDQARLNEVRASPGA